MTFAPTPAMTDRLILAQSFDTGTEGSGDADSILGAIENFTQNWVAIGGAVIGLAFVIAVVKIGFTMRRGGSIGEAFSGVAIIFIVAILLGVGTRAIGWLIGMGGGLA